MPSTLTPRVSLAKADPNDLVNVDTQINAAFDILDKAVGVFACTSSTRPVTGNFDGRLIRETDTNFLFYYNVATLTWVQLGFDFTAGTAASDGAVASYINTPSSATAIALVAKVVANIPAGVPVTDIQVFTASGTWTKPAGAKMVEVICIGAGGGGCGGANDYSGGGGGSRNQMSFPSSALGSTETVTVATGGTGGSQSTGGSAGMTSFGLGLLVTAGGGSGGLGVPGGAGGGTFSNAITSNAGGPRPTYYSSGNVIGGQGATGNSVAEYGGGSGGGSNSPGSGSIYGGGGGGYNGQAGGANGSYTSGGGGAASTGSGVTPVAVTSRTGTGRANHGGGGGIGLAVGAAGGIPGGGGGASGATGGTQLGGAGGRGEVIVTTYF